MGEGRVTSAGAGVPDVSVSDGRTVVRSAADGSFVLDASGPHVYVSVPTGYTCDRWYLAGDADRFDFELVAEDQPVPFTFAQVTDFHLALGSRAFVDGDATMYLADGGIKERIVSTPEVVAALYEEVRAEPDVAFAVVTGDQTNSGTEDELAAYVSVAEGSGLRLVHIAGNHDHSSADVETAKKDGERFGPDAYLTRYDRHLGPRWFSFSYGGLHFVAIDWTTHHRGLERAVQEAWVRADLEHATEPVIFLTHDLMQAAFWDATGASPVASLSGHWHTTRVVRARGGLHVNTSPSTFGGLDFSPAHYRVLTWDGSQLSVRSRLRGSLRGREDLERPQSGMASQPRWEAALRYAAHRNGAVVAGDAVLASSGSEDEPAGALQAFDAATGDERWAVALGSAVKTAPRVIGDRVVATAVTGETVCVSIADGTELWRAEIDDPLRLWVFLRPATDGRRVFVGDTARFVALDVEDGSVVWQRDDVGVRGNITCHAHPAVVDGTLMVAFAAQVPDMWALDAETGQTRWPAGGEAASIYDLGSGAIPMHLPRVVVSGFGVDPDEPDVYVVRLGKQLDRIRVADASVVWSAQIGGWFNPATPVIDGSDVYVCEGMGKVWCLDRATGEVRWTTEVTTSSPVHMGPYRDEGGALFGEPVLTGTHVIVACGDGRVVAVSRADGRITAEVDLGVPFAAPPAMLDDTLYLAGMDGVLRALPRFD